MSPQDKLLETINDLETQAIDNAARLGENGLYEKALRQQIYAEAFRIVKYVIKDMPEKASEE